MNRRRVATTALIVGVTLTLLAVLLLRPGRITAPAVLEYAPLTVLRAQSPGFVRQVLVSSGEAVVQGQPVVVLGNDDLLAELKDLELAREQSLIKSRMLTQAREGAKLQVEAANCQALEKKIAELECRLESLTVRAPAAGRVLAKDLDTLPGRYLEVGTEIAVLGREDAKELLVALRQEDIDRFGACLGSGGELRVRAACGDRLTARLTSINPRGGAEIPHAALAATLGGPLAVKPVAAAEATDKPNRKYELISPMFVGKAALSTEASRRLHAGQLATVSFRTMEETAGLCWLRVAQEWLARHARP